jgi:hypothetical protein
MFSKRFFVSAVLSIIAIITFVCLVSLSGCGGSSKPPSVAVTASATTVDATDTVTLTAAVTNDKNTNGTADGVTWSVSGGGTLSGTTTTGATYTAPAAASAVQTVTVTATSVADTSKTASVTLTVPAQLTVTTTSSQLSATVGTAFSQQLANSSAISPYKWSLATGSALPTGWNLSSAGLLTGTAPTAGQVGTFNFTADVADSGTPTAMTASAALTVTINPAPAITFTGTMPATATYNVAYTGSAAATGGAGTLGYTAAGLPSWLVLNAANGAIAGTPAAAGTFKFTVTAADAFGDSASQAYTIVVSYPPVTITPASGSLPTGYTGTAYSQALSVTGGSGAGYTWTITGLSDGLTSSASGATATISGSPTSAQKISFTASVTDGAGNSSSVNSYTIQVYDPLTLPTTNPSTLPSVATVNVAYTGTVAVSGGSGNYSWAVTGLSDGLTSSTSGATMTISGTPTATGTISVTATVTDTTTSKTAGPITYTIAASNALTLPTTNPSTLPSFATVGVNYTGTVVASGGSGNYSWTVTGASDGLTSSTSGGTLTISGTPTATGTVTFSATVTDTTTQKSVGPIQYTINAYNALAVTPATLPIGYPGTAYPATSFAATGGSGTYSKWTWAAASGSSLPSGLSLSQTTGAISGTPVNTGTSSVVSNVAVTVTDSAGETATANFTLTIEAALAISTASPLPTGLKGTAYSQQFNATGGTGSYTWSLTGASDAANLQTLGLTFSNSGLLSGTSAVAGGPVTFTAQVSDGTHTASGTFSVTISTSMAITTTTLPAAGLAGSSYNATLAASGGSGSYNWSVTSGATSLSAIGLSLNSSTGVLSGTLVAGTASFTVTATDATNSSLKATQNYSITVSPALVLTPNPNPLPTFTSGQTYNGTITVSGGSGSYAASFQINDGSGWQTVPPYQGGQLPLASGFSLAMQNTNELIIGGTPTITTALPLNVMVTDSLGNVITQTFTLSPVGAALTVTLNSAPQGMVNMPYTYSGVSVSGGSGNPTVTYTNTPAGLANGTSANNDGNLLVGTPTASGTTTVTVKVTDGVSTPVTKTFSLTVVPETVAAHNSYLNGQYACYIRKYWDGGVTGGNGTSTLHQGGAVLAFFADGKGNITSGEMDTNSPYSGYKSASTLGSLGGTYAVGADNRGYLMVTVGSNGSGVLALAGGDLNGGSMFSEFAITEMDDAGTDPSGQHGSGHCYLQNTTTAFTGTQPSGGYVFKLTGEDISGEPESIVGSVKFTGSKTVSGLQDVVDYATPAADLSFSGTNTTADSFGRVEMTAGPSGETPNTTVMYLTNNSKGQTLLMGEQPHNGSSDADFVMGEARAQVSTVLTASNPLAGAGMLYAEGSNSASGYKTILGQFTGSSSAASITFYTSITNNAGKFKLDATSANGGVTGSTLPYSVDTVTGRTTLTGASGVYVYIYNTNSAAILFTDTNTSGTGVNNMAGWIEPQTAPTSGSWAIGDVATSYFMYKIENGDYNDDSQTSVLTVDSGGNIGDFVSDDGGQSWASWDEGMTGDNGTPETAAIALDATDGKYGLLDVNFTSGTTTTTESYCYAISVDAATNSGTKGKLLCLDASSSNPKISVIQE